MRRLSRLVLRLRARLGLFYAAPLTPNTWRDPQGCQRLPVGHRIGWADRQMLDQMAREDAARTLRAERDQIVAEGWAA